MTVLRCSLFSILSFIPFFPAIHTHTHSHIHVFILSLSHAHSHTQIQACSYTCAHTQTRACTHSHSYEPTCTYTLSFISFLPATHTYSNTHMHRHTCTCAHRHMYNMQCVRRPCRKRLLLSKRKDTHTFAMEKNSSVFLKNEFSIRPRKKLKKCFFFYLIGTCVCAHTRVTERARERGRERR